MIKFVDLFSGTGGIRLGFEQAMKEIGLSTKCVKSSEIDKKACETYKLNFDEESYCDIHDVDIDESFDLQFIQDCKNLFVDFHIFMDLRQFIAAGSKKCGWSPFQ